MEANYRGKLEFGGEFRGNFLNLEAKFLSSVERQRQFLDANSQLEANYSRE
jgi:hypothetical protein